jgi:ERCC4-type nuclease
VYRTNNVNETANYILYLSDKLEREKKKTPFYSNIVSNTILNETIINEPIELNTDILPTVDDANEETYSSVIKKVKKDNITIQNIGEIVLSQIPNVSSQSACAIMDKFKTIKHLIDCLENDPKCLDGIVIGKSGKTRRLNKNCISNVFKFMLQRENEIIF